MIREIRNSVKWQYFVVFIALIPLFFIGKHGWHDWEGDFAQYIHQVKNIWEGVPISENHYVYNPDLPFLAPPTYPVGFSLLLIPVYALFGNSMVAFQIYITAILVGSMFLFFELIRKQTAFLSAFLIVLFLAFNHWVLEFKQSIVSDIPLLFFFLLILLLYSKNRELLSLKKSLLIGTLIGFAILIKNIAASLLLMIFLDQLVSLFQRKFSRSWLINNILLGSSTLFIYLVAQFTFPPKQESFSFFSKLFQQFNGQHSLADTAQYYWTEFEGLFFHREFKGHWFAKTLAIAVGIGALIGVLFSIRKRFYLVALLCLFVFVVLFFPNQNQGIRYFLPVLPVFFYFFLIAMSKLKKQWGFIFIFLLCCGQSYLAYEQKIRWKELNLPEINGALGEKEQQFFSFVAQKTEGNALIVFEKPRVLGLYSSRNSYAVNAHKGKEFVQQQLEELSWDYIATHPEVYNHSLDLLLRDWSKQQKIECIFYHEKGFALFRPKEQ